MSAEYGLYHHRSKQFIWLGKPRGLLGEGLAQFQMASERIVAFIVAKREGYPSQLELCSDVRIRPDDGCEEEWILADAWWLSHAESCIWDSERAEYVSKEVLMAGDGGLIDDSLQELLKFIRGEGHHWGQGITTYPRLKEKRALHEDCLRLETMGLLYRHYESEKVIVWMPKEVL